MKEKKITNKKGFTLIEMMVSIFIFAIIMTAIVSIFAQQIKAYKYAITVEGDLENAQFALNYISKTLRTSSLVGQGTAAGGTNLVEVNQSGVNWENDFSTITIESGDGLIVYDFSQEACVIFSFRENNPNYNYDESALWVETQTGKVGPNDIYDCLKEEIYDDDQEDAGYKKQRLTSGDVTGTFEVAPTRYRDHNESRNTDTIGKATITMRVEPVISIADKDNVNPIYVQSSVALRDYPSDLSF